MQQRDPENQATPVNPFENLTEEERQQHNIPLNSWEQKWASVQAYRSSLDDDVPYHVAEMSDSYKGQEPHPPAQSDMVMFAPSNAGESKQSEKPRRRTFEDIRAENRKHRIHANQEPSHVPHDNNTVGESQFSQGNIKKRPPRRNQYGDIIYDDE